MNQELIEMASAHLRTIELVREMTIVNAREVAAWIAALARSEQDVSDVCTVLNTWIAIKDTGVVEIPETIVHDFMKRVQDRSAVRSR